MMQGLKIYKLDWVSVWKFVVPYRDPSLLPRQWRIATGTQKSYKMDGFKKEKRRIYEANKRKHKPADPSRWDSSSDKEVCCFCFKRINIASCKNLCVITFNVFD